MSFFKNIGKLAGNFLGFRSGASSQARNFNSDWGDQISLASAQNQAQKFAFDSALKTQALYDQTQATIDGINKSESQEDETKVILGKSGKRSFFNFGA